MRQPQVSAPTANAARRTSAVRWGVARRIAAAWGITLPMSGLIAAIAYVAGGVVFR